MLDIMIEEHPLTDRVWQAFEGQRCVFADLVETAEQHQAQLRDGEHCLEEFSPESLTDFRTHVRLCLFAQKLVMRMTHHNLVRSLTAFALLYETISGMDFAQQVDVLS